MFTILRLTNRNLISGAILKKMDLLETVRRTSVTLKPLPVKPTQPEDHDIRNMKKKRPLSPHLGIYAIQLTSSLSITHRITGTIMATYLAALGFSSLMLPEKFNHYVELLERTSESLNMSPYAVYLIKFSLAFPFCYHFFNGIRHLVWDTGAFVNNQGVTTTGYAMLACTFPTAIALTLYVIP